MVSAVVISEFFSGGGIGTLFSLVLGFTISTTTLSYLFIFPAFLILRYKYAHVRRTYPVPTLFPQVFQKLLHLGTFVGEHGPELLPIVDKDGMCSLERYQHVWFVVPVYVHKLERNRN